MGDRTTKNENKENEIININKLKMNSLKWYIIIVF